MLNPKTLKVRVAIKVNDYSQLKEVREHFNKGGNGTVVNPVFNESIKYPLYILNFGTYFTCRVFTGDISTIVALKLDYKDTVIKPLKRVKDE